MLKADVAVIGGTGTGERLASLPGTDHDLATTFGNVCVRCSTVQGVTCALLQRHSAGHAVPPHRVNYRAMALALASLGVKGCLSTAAVGSLRPEWPIGTLAVCTDFIDLTSRNLTLFDGVVTHTDFSVPFPLAGALNRAATELGVPVQPSAVYVGANGPRYETPAEIRMMQRLGGDVVGMTASSEAIAMREAGVPYGCLAVVTNYGCGIEPGQLRHGEVVDTMNVKGETVLEVLSVAARLLPG